MPNGPGAVRRFERRDPAGVEHQVLVLEIRPARAWEPWLLFVVLTWDCRDVVERRRLAPAPAGWREMPSRALEECYERATPMSGDSAGPPLAPQDHLTGGGEARLIQGLTEQLAFTQALLVAAQDYQDYLNAELRRCEQELAATTAELQTVNAELQARYTQGT